MTENLVSKELSAGEDREVKNQVPPSPRWGLPTKLIVGLLLVSGAVALLIRFNNYVKLVLFALIISFLIYPLCNFLSKRLRIRWRVSVTIVYLLLAALIVWVLARGGTSIVGQVQNLIDTIQRNLETITKFMEQWSNRIIMVGPFEFTTPKLDTSFITQTISQLFQPLLGQAGNVAGQVVGSVSGFIFNLVITIMVSFFLTAESEGARNQLFNIHIKGYEYDSKRMGQEISKIFNSFIRGEFTVVGAAMLIYSVVLGILGLPYFLLLALIAGIGRFIPYLGAWIGLISFFISALFQTPTPFGLTPFVYGLVVVGIALIIDMLLDNGLMPKVMGNSLEVHPAAIMISALIGSQLLGLLGIILAAPVLATSKLLLRYSVRKLLDQDPWEGMSYYKKPKEPGLFKVLRRMFRKVGNWLDKPWSAVKIFVTRLWGKMLTWFKGLTSKDQKSGTGGDQLP